jgi:AraC family transcriptional regulator
MTPDIKILPEKKIIGKRMKMALSANKTHELWRSFMPARKEIRNSLSAELFSIQVFAPDFDFINFDINVEFDKWAGVEVPDFSNIPEGMEPIILQQGLYAVFIHKGPANRGEETFKYIFTEWLPKSGYEIDNRPHFEILGEKYRNDAPDSEEEVWIPIRSRSEKM